MPKDPSFPAFEQKNKYVLDLANLSQDEQKSVWDDITKYLDANDNRPQGIQNLYNVFEGKKYYEDGPEASDLRNILDATIALWKYRSLNLQNQSSAALTVKPPN